MSSFRSNCLGLRFWTNYLGLRQQAEAAQHRSELVQQLLTSNLRLPSRHEKRVEQVRASFSTLPLRFSFCLSGLVATRFWRRWSQTNSPGLRSAARPGSKCSSSRPLRDCTRQGQLYHKVPEASTAGV